MKPIQKVHNLQAPQLFVVERVKLVFEMGSLELAGLELQLVVVQVLQ